MVGVGVVVLVVLVEAYWVAMVVADFEARVGAADVVASELVVFAAAAAVAVADDAVARAFVALVISVGCFEMMVVFVVDALAVEDVEEPVQSVCLLLVVEVRVHADVAAVGDFLVVVVAFLAGSDYLVVY